MSDCANQSGYAIHGSLVYTDGTESCFTFSRMVNGVIREPAAVVVDGELYERVRECEIRRYSSPTHQGVVLADCSACGSPLDFDNYLDKTKVNVRVNYCPTCGAKVVS